MFDRIMPLTHWPTVLMISVFFGLFVLERVCPLRQRTRPILPRLVSNLVMTLLVIAVVQVTVRPTVAYTLALNKAYHFGLIPLLGLSGWYEVIIAFLLLDLSFYYWHRLNHKTALLWRFHNVHHVDPDMDVSTAMRFHFGEIAYSSLFRFVQLLIIGVTPATLLFYELLFQLATYFHHSNLRLGKTWEKALAYVIITPGLHGIHHSNYRDETDSNYGVIFSVWDRLHQTLQRSVRQQDITIGVPGYAQPKDNRLKSLLLMPFQRQRDYWTSLDNRPHDKRH